MNKNYKLLNSIYFLFKSLDQKRKYQFIGIIIINIINGLLEFISVGSALLFLESLVDPNKISDSFSFITSSFKINNNYELIRTTTLIFILINLINTFVRISNLWLKY